MGGGMMWGYANLAKHLGEDQPLYALKSCEPEQAGAFNTVEKMAAHYVEEMRRIQPQGPYRVGGYCFGGTVAFEMACQLEARGEKVERLILINAWPSVAEHRMRWTSDALARFAGNLWPWISRLWHWNRRSRLRALRWKTLALQRSLIRSLRRSEQPAELEVDQVFDLSEVAPSERRRPTRARSPYSGPGAIPSSVRLTPPLAGRPTLKAASQRGWSRGCTKPC
jgi:pimeloyl-ACP methyl ester carboxylesterase